MTTGIGTAGLNRIILGLLSSPLIFGLFVSIAAACLIRAISSPSVMRQALRLRLDSFLERDEDDEDEEERIPFTQRVLAPMFRRLVHRLGRMSPKRNTAMIQKMLVCAGEPFHLSALDFFGLRALVALVVAFLALLVLKKVAPSFGVALLLAVPMGGVGAFLPLFWLRSRVKKRQAQIRRALPDALDMLTIGVEAGLAFESALLRVGERWDNPLTEEFRRVVTEMRLGTPRDLALKHIIDRTDVAELSTFVAILVQANQLGLSISQVLHSQAAQMRQRRRQRAEELARQASIKMLLPLVFFIFPAVLVVVLGPAVPTMMELIQTMGGAK